MENSESPWEDNLFERKVESDLKDLLKTFVAFANSVKPGHIAIVVIGEKDDGTVVGVKNPDEVQKTIRKECDRIYPALLWQSSVFQKEGKNCVRVEIEYSGETPFFGGISWVRKGSETIKASDEIFQRLIEIRSGKVRELARWVGKPVTVRSDFVVSNSIREGTNAQRIFDSLSDRSSRWHVFTPPVSLVSVNQHWATFEFAQNKNRVSEPISKLTLSFDNSNDRLEILVAP